ncbi:BTAD domain-containing putative transcriptional regulator [Streptomyces sp. NPDC059398]|uniref:AfsR/SARP family transcriptional regulator n=1 Tax=Streptomyces sp. NPDC059398 TaxID=3346820 RepID=UPI00368EA375
MATLDIAVLGPFLLRLDGRPVELPSMRQRALLATLALHAGQTVAKGALTELVWGESPPQHIASSLYTLVSRLRSLLGDELVRTAPGGYRLDVPPERVDALRFQQLLEASLDGSLDMSVEADAGTAHRLVADALALWRGTPLADAGSPVENAYAVALTEQYLGAVERNADLQLRAGALPSAELVAELLRLTNRHPLRESLWQRLLAALGASGRLAEALEAYETVRRTLDDQLGTPPSAELRSLYAELLRTAPVPPTAAPETPPPAAAAPPAPDPGQAASPEPPTSSLASSLLPARPDGFVGRTVELALFDELPGSAYEDSGPAAVAVVHGIGGVGKTALALHWAHAAGRHFPGGRFYIDLHGYGLGTPVTPHHALGLLLAQLGIDPERVPAHTDERRALWRTSLAARRALVVLDNAHSAQQVRPLLPGADGCALVTSRSRLSGLTIRDGARSVPLGELTDAEAARVLAEVIGGARTTAEPDAVARLARACGRLPLALRIIAEQLSRHPVAKLADFAADFEQAASPGDGSGRLGSLDVLAVADDPVCDVRTVFSWSYEQLDPGAARLFRLLSLVPGDAVDTGAAAALADRPAAEVRAVLAGLAGLHLLEEDGPGRYRAHDLLREYAAERTTAEDSADEREAALERLLTWYVHSVDAAVGILAPRWNGLPLPAGIPAAPLPEFDGSPSDAPDWLDCHCSALVAAVEYTARQGPYLYAWLLADRLRGYFWRSLRVAEWQATADAALAAADAHGDVSARAAAALTAADLHGHTSRPDDAVLLYRRAGRLAREAGRPDLAATVLNNLAGTLWRFGRLVESAACLTEVLEINRRLGRAHGEFSAHLNLASVCMPIGRTQEAHDHLMRSLALADGQQERARVMINLARTTHAVGRLDEALRYAHQALPALRGTNDTTWQADCHCYLAAIHRDRGEQDLAEAEAQAALRFAETTQDPLVQAESLVTVGAVRLHFARHADAEPFFLRALSIARENGLLHVEAGARTGLGSAAAAAGRTAEAAGHATAAVALAQEHGFADRTAEAQLALGRVRLLQRDLAAAEELAGCAANAHEAAGLRVGHARSMLLLAQVRAAADAPGAATALAEATALLSGLGCAVRE